MNGIGIESSEYREEERGRILLLGVRHSNRDWVFEENGVARDMPRRGNRNTWLLRLLITTDEWFF